MYAWDGDIRVLMGECDRAVLVCGENGNTIRVEIYERKDRRAGLAWEEGDNGEPAKERSSRYIWISFSLRNMSDSS